MYTENSININPNSYLQERNKPHEGTYLLKNWTAKINNKFSFPTSRTGKNIAITACTAITGLAVLGLGYLLYIGVEDALKCPFGGTFNITANVNTPVLLFGNVSDCWLSYDKTAPSQVIVGNNINANMTLRIGSEIINITMAEAGKIFQFFLENLSPYAITATPMSPGEAEFTVSLQTYPNAQVPSEYVNQITNIIADSMNNTAITVFQNAINTASSSITNAVGYLFGR